MFRHITTTTSVNLGGIYYDRPTRKVVHQPEVERNIAFNNKNYLKSVEYISI